MNTMKNWNLQKRKNLELMIERGLSLKEMSQTSGMSVHAIREELLRGLEGEDRAKRRYVRYLVEVAIKTIVNEAVGEDGLNCYLQYRRCVEEMGEEKARLKMKELHNGDD